MDLEAAVARACERLSREGVEGWGLWVPDDLPGEVVILGPAYGCTSETCAHNSHSPAAPERRWVPPDGSLLIFLGEEDEENEWFVLRSPEGDRFLRLYRPRHFWAEIYEECSDCVPEFLLASLVQEVS